MKGFGTGRNASASAQDADRIAADIDSGWRDDTGVDDTGEVPRQYDNQYDRRDSRYADDSLDRGWESTEDNQSGYDTGYAAAPYGPADPTPRDRSRTAYEKKVYGDDLYGVEDTGYESEPVEEGPEELIDPDGVYEADYRVIVPPSRPLDVDEND